MATVHKILPCLAFCACAAFAEMGESSRELVVCREITYNFFSPKLVNTLDISRELANFCTRVYRDKVPL